MFTICLVLAIFLSPPEGDADVTTNRPVNNADDLVADQLAHALIRHHDALTAVSLVYKSVPSVEGKPEGNYWRRAMSASGTGMFKVDNSHGHKRLPWQDDTRRKSLVVTQSESTLLSQVNRSVVNLDSSSGEAINSIYRELIFEVLCWWPFADWPPPQHQSCAYSMRELLKDRSYRLLPEKTLVRGRPCFTLIVNDIVTVWCDCDQPERVLKSELYNSKFRAIESRFELMEYEEVADGIWLPKKFRVTRFDSHAHTPQLRETVVYDNTFLVSDIRVNADVEKSAFRQDYAPGTVRASHSPEGIQYEPIVDGQLDHFNSIVKWCRLVASETAAVKRLRRSDCLVAFASSFLLGCSLVVVGYRSVLRVQAQRSSP